MHIQGQPMEAMPHFFPPPHLGTHLMAASSHIELEKASTAKSKMPRLFTWPGDCWWGLGLDLFNCHQKNQPDHNQKHTYKTRVQQNRQRYSRTCATETLGCIQESPSMLCKLDSLEISRRKRWMISWNFISFLIHTGRPVSATIDF